ncbi:hypothetical protein, variant [Sphaeroforma arctica JP610]|uniref:Uncharacterized protein n=1 Tax=Sphaeroforma arctica JP610 TaxID=667725 RepID=A0A0L0G5M0_9EUKA|nr:hypothetical protein, variant [Sphaeroforma arctica JP610]KNC84332.1 hypothetical protein, variant [Sphaeroforma arctica JP610]|eukprot:XP_014158234.1 hypothetical protein, variant [Sphaeroforma arctica JP610]
MMSDEESQSLLGIELHQYTSLSSVGNETVHGGGGRGLYQSDGSYFHEYSHTRSNRYRRRSNALVLRLADKFRVFGRNFSLRASPSTVALCVAFAATILGAGFSFDDNSTFWATVEYCGLFGVIGGLLSGLSVRLLFARSCGAVPRHGDDIKARLKSTIFDRIFKRECIALYLRKALHESLDTLNIDERIEWIIDSPAVNKVLDKKLNELLASKHGVYLHLAGFSLREFKPAIKPYLINFSSELTPAVCQCFVRFFPPMQ